jgi:DsbC/DsbD-like thiol-disulfide interchange protein
MPALGGVVGLLGGVMQPPGATPPDAPATKGEAGAKAKASLICEQSGLTPGSTAMIAVSWELKPKWHMYWPGRNDTGEPPSVSFELPAGYTVDAIQWPAPERHVESDMLSHVYFNRLTVLAPLHVPATAEAGSTVTLKAKLSWMICEDTCVAEQSDVKLKLPIVAATGGHVERSAEAKLIEAARKRVPKELEKNSKDVRVSWGNKTVRIDVLGATHLAFYPDELCVPFSNPIADCEIDRSIMTARLGDPEKDHTALAGVLEIRRGKEEREWVHVHLDPSATIENDLPKNPSERPPLVPSSPSNPEPKPQPKPIP